MAGEQRSPVQTRIRRSFSSFLRDFLVLVFWHREQEEEATHVKQHPDAKVFFYNRKRYAYGNGKKKERIRKIFFSFFSFFLCVCFIFFSVVVVANNRFQQPQDKSVGIATKSHDKFQGDMQSGVRSTKHNSRQQRTQSIDRHDDERHTQIAQNTHTQTQIKEDWSWGNSFYFFFVFFSPHFFFF
jgi:hypothetical protein